MFPLQICFFCGFKGDYLLKNGLIQRRLCLRGYELLFYSLFLGRMNILQKVWAKRMTVMTAFFILMVCLLLVVKMIFTIKGLRRRQQEGDQVEAVGLKKAERTLTVVASVLGVVVVMCSLYIGAAYILVSAID